MGMDVKPFVRVVEWMVKRDRECKHRSVLIRGNFVK